MSRARSLPLVGLMALAACAEPPMQPLAGVDNVSSRAANIGEKTYVVIAQGNALPSTLAADMAAAGGVVASRMDQIGVATVTSSDPNFATNAGQAAGIHAVVEDVMLDFEQPVVGGEIAADETQADGTTHEVGGHEGFRLIQWAPDAVRAPGAWALGHQGAGARVAILDGGIHSTHRDLKDNLDVARSASMVPGQPFNFDLRRGPPPARLCNVNDTFWHGTHVAGIVAAAANDFGTVGIAPKATIIGVKVLHCGSGAFSWIMNGIYYAATPIAEGGAGAHIINMSLGAGIDGRSPGIAFLLNALSRATSYARMRGVTVIAAAGNDAVNLDQTNNLVFVPAQSVGVVAVAATGPMGWAVPGNAFDLDRPASYSNHGQSAINLAGPGGDSALPGNALCSKPRLDSVNPLVTACWVFDMVLSTSRGSGAATNSYSWASGTSMASPAVAGVAALIVGKYGPMGPAQLEAILRNSADDLGKPGNDDHYGRGRVNATRAVQ